MKNLMLAAAAAISLIVTDGNVHAEEIQLPQTLGITAYPAETGSFAQAVAMGLAVGQKYGASIRVIPANTDPARLAPMVTGRTQFAMTGSDAIYAQEGVFNFADRSAWGPQAIGMLLMNVPDGGVGLAVAPTLNGKTPDALRGMRVAYVAPSPSLRLVTEAYLTFGGLTWDDVEKVEFSGFSQSIEAFIAGEVDAVVSGTDSGSSTRIAAGPRGLGWLVTPAEDTESWARVKDKLPWFSPRRVTFGNGIPEGDGMDFAVARYPVIMTRMDQDEAVVYSMARALIETYPAYKDSALGGEGWSVDRQDMQYFLPWHAGVVPVWQEMGLWNDRLAADQAVKVLRQQVLAAAWADVNARTIADDDAFQDAWMTARRDALKAAGLKSYF